MSGPEKKQGEPQGLYCEPSEVSKSSPACKLGSVVLWVKAVLYPVRFLKPKANWRLMVLLKKVGGEGDTRLLHLTTVYFVLHCGRWTVGGSGSPPLLVTVSSGAVP